LCRLTKSSHSEPACGWYYTTNHSRFHAASTTPDIPPGRSWPGGVRAAGRYWREVLAIILDGLFEPVNKSKAYQTSLRDSTELLGAFRGLEVHGLTSEHHSVVGLSRALTWVWQRKGTRVLTGPELSGTPARGAIPFSSFPEVLAALRPPATFCQPSGLGAYGGLAIVIFSRLLRDSI